MEKHPFLAILESSDDVGNDMLEEAFVEYFGRKDYERLIKPFLSNAADTSVKISSKKKLEVTITANDGLALDSFPSEGIEGIVLRYGMRASVVVTVENKIWRPKKEEYIALGFEQDPLGESARDFGYEIEGACDWTPYPIMFHYGQDWWKWDGDSGIEPFYPKDAEAVFRTIEEIKASIN